MVVGCQDGLGIVGLDIRFNQKQHKIVASLLYNHSVETLDFKGIWQSDRGLSLPGLLQDG